ncbi:hypothetical protein EDB89DRAFT_1364233 [Lactarius sanguifluus]|nr:hypothetical protein EDB89DRAFT_1364233 [Lactarius sanguifluus]
MSDRKAPPPTPRPRPPPPTSSKPVVQPRRSGSTSGTAGSSSTTAVPSSLFTTLTKPTTEGYPATEVIKYLIEVVGRDVVSFRRNAQVSYMLVDRARDICDAINIHVKKTESGIDWSSFERFTDAIDPVEDALFKLVAFTEDEKELHLVEGNSVQDCIIYVNNWATNREEIWSMLDHLETTTELTNLFSGVDVTSRQVEREEARIHDDRTFFEEVIEEIDRAFSGLSKVPNTVRTMTGNLRELLNKVSAGAIPPGITAFTLKAGLLVQGVTRLAFETPSLDPTTVAHLRSAPVWGAAAQLVELLNSTRDDDAESMDNVRVKYEEFLGFLHNFTGKDLDVPRSYIDLLKLAGQVRRPFHSQAVALISLCRMLVTEFEKDAYRTPDNLVSLEEVLDVTLNGLQDAVAAVTELKMFNLASFEDHPAYRALARAQARIRACHKSFGLGDWNQWELFIVDAIRKDKERMDRLNKLLETRPPLTSQERVGQFELTVEVYDRSTLTVVHQTTYSMEGSTRLSAVRWTIAGALEESLRKHARQNGEFWLLPDALCKLHDSISQLAGSSKRLSLRLII